MARKHRQTIHGPVAESIRREERENPPERYTSCWCCGSDMPPSRIKRCLTCERQNLEAVFVVDLLHHANVVSYEDWRSKLYGLMRRKWNTLPPLRKIQLAHECCFIARSQYGTWAGYWRTFQEVDLPVLSAKAFNQQVA